MKTSIKLYRSSGVYYSADMLPILCAEYVVRFYKPYLRKSNYIFRDMHLEDQRK